MKLKIKRSLQEMLHLAHHDLDDASVFVNGENWENCDGAIIIISGRDKAFRAATILANAGMRTPDKPMTTQPKERDE